MFIYAFIMAYFSVIVFKELFFPICQTVLIFLYSFFRFFSSLSRWIRYNCFLEVKLVKHKISCDSR